MVGILLTYDNYSANIGLALQSAKPERFTEDLMVNIINHGTQFDHGIKDPMIESWLVGRCFICPRCGCSFQLQQNDSHLVREVEDRRDWLQGTHVILCPVSCCEG